VLPFAAAVAAVSSAAGIEALSDVARGQEGRGVKGAKKNKSICCNNCLNNLGLRKPW
jgi:hypothetical protein